MQDNQFTLNAKKIIATKYDELKKELENNLDNYHSRLQEIRVLETNYRAIGISLSKPMELSNLFFEEEKEVFYKNLWQTEIEENWGTPNYKSLNLKKFITDLKYEPTSEITGEIFCHGMMYGKYSAACLDFLSLELGHEKCLLITKEVARILANAFYQWSWNGKDIFLRDELNYNIEQAEHVYLYQDLRYQSILCIGNVLSES